MISAADHLWQINNEYRRLLSKIRKYADLLEQLILTRDDQNGVQVLTAVRYAQRSITRLDEDHRRWRYEYYYEAGGSKRMVQSNQAVVQALNYFRAMSQPHQQVLEDVYTLLASAARPAASLTHVPNGDLWTMLQYAVSETAQFIQTLD